tara:strand:- start:5061 stop:6200 length:1140 start_codon:yes stop_codon:yes gene_type:complete
MSFFDSKILIKRRKNVLILPVNTGGTILYIKEALIELGYQTRILTFVKHPYCYKSDYTIFNQGDCFFQKEIKKIISLKHLIYSRYVIYNYGRTIFFPEINEKKGIYRMLKSLYNYYLRIMRIVEISLNKIFNNQIIFIFSGDDARLKKYCIKNYDISPAHFLYKSGYYSDLKDNLKIKNINFVDRIADNIFALNPDILNTLPNRSIFLAYPYKNNNNYRIHSYSNDLLKILHMPSNRDFKGTYFIKKTIDELKLLNYNIEFKIIENESNDKLLKIICNYDLVIDQLLAGWYGSVAVESMSMGIPVMAYIRNLDLKYIPREMSNELPIINVNINNLKEQIVKYANLSINEKLEISKSSYKFSKKWHSIKKCKDLFKNNLK